jgi:hypothetical protein
MDDWNVFISVFFARQNRLSNPKIDNLGKVSMFFPRQQPKRSIVAQGSQTSIPIQFSSPFLDGIDPELQKIHVYHKQNTEERIRRCRERQREGDLVMPVVFATEDETPAQHVRRLPMDDAAATAEDLLVAMKFLPLSRELVRCAFCCFVLVQCSVEKALVRGTLVICSVVFLS